MEGLRGFAVALVFLVHYVTLSGATNPVAMVLHKIGNSGVDLSFGQLVYRLLAGISQRTFRA